MAGMELPIPWIIVCAILAVLLLWQVVEGVLRAALFFYEKVQRKYGLPRNVMTGREGLIGRTALVVRSFEPVGCGRVEGLVFLGGATWSARLKDGFERPSKSFVSVRVEDLDGLTLIVSEDTGVAP